MPANNSSIPPRIKERQSIPGAEDRWIVHHFNEPLLRNGERIVISAIHWFDAKAIARRFLADEELAQQVRIVRLEVNGKQFPMVFVSLRNGELVERHIVPETLK